MNKIKRLIKAQGTQGNALKLKTEREEANKIRKNIKAILANMNGGTIGQLQKERFERIKAVFEKVDEKLDQIDLEIQQEEEKPKSSVIEEEEEVNESEETESLIKKQEKDQKQLAGWQKRYMELELHLALETRDRVISLEHDMIELNTMFKDTETLVDRQGEGLNIIENDVEESIQNVEVAVEKLKVGISYQKASRWKYIVFGGIMLGLVVFAIVLVFVGLKKF